MYYIQYTLYRYIPYVWESRYIYSAKNRYAVTRGKSNTAHMFLRFLDAALIIWQNKKGLLVPTCAFSHLLWYGIAIQLANILIRRRIYSRLYGKLLLATLLRNIPSKGCRILHI